MYLRPGPAVALLVRWRLLDSDVETHCLNLQEIQRQKKTEGVSQENISLLQAMTH